MSIPRWRPAPTGRSSTSACVCCKVWDWAISPWARRRPALSGGEAQRLKLASEIGKTQTDSVFVFDEPSIGLHPLDVRVLLGVFQALLDNGATVIVIEHDLDVIRNADYVIDMGPGGGDAGGRIVAVGTPQEIRADENSITGPVFIRTGYRST